MILLYFLKYNINLTLQHVSSCKYKVAKGINEQNYFL